MQKTAMAALSAGILSQIGGAVLAEGSSFPLFDRALGTSRVLNNDIIGDGKDRWRTGSYDVSLTFGKTPKKALPTSAFQLMQYRARAEIIAPDNLVTATPFPDRPYAGILGLGAFTHFQAGSLNVSYGGELVMVGPSTGLSSFQSAIHDVLGISSPNPAAGELSDKIYPTIQGEISRDMFQGDTLIRPFAEAQAGIETYARVGVDVVFGGGVSRNFFLRDPVTGHLLTNVSRSEVGGFGFLMGADMAYVADSQLLPKVDGYSVRKARPRARAGVVYEGGNLGMFYGVTWLGREFEAQPEGQMTGSLHVDFRF